MRKIYSFTILLLVSLFLLSCEKDDDDSTNDDTKSDNAVLIIGNWKLTEKDQFICDKNTTEEIHNYSAEGKLSVDCPDVGKIEIDYLLKNDGTVLSLEGFVGGFNDYVIVELTETKFSYMTPDGIVSYVRVN